MDTLICHGLAYLLSTHGYEGEVIPMDRRYLIELREEPDWQLIVNRLVEDLMEALEYYDTINRLIKERQIAIKNRDRDREFEKVLRAYMNTEGGRLHIAVESQGVINARKSVQKLRRILEKLSSLNPNLSSVYTEDHVLRYGEGRSKIVSAARRTVRVKKVKVEKYTAPLPIIGFAGKYMTGLYEYASDSLKICHWDLALSWLGLCRSAAVLREGRGDGISIILLRPIAPSTPLSEIHLAQSFALGGQTQTSLPLAAAVLFSILRVGEIPELEEEIGRVLETIASSRWSVIAYRFEKQQPRRPYAIRRISEYPAFRLLQFLKESRRKSINLYGIARILMQNGDLDVLELMAESIIYGNLDGFANSIKAAFTSLSLSAKENTRLLKEELAELAIKLFST